MPLVSMPCASKLPPPEPGGESAARAPRPLGLGSTPTSPCEWPSSFSMFGGEMPVGVSPVLALPMSPLPGVMPGPSPELAAASFTRPVGAPPSRVTICLDLFSGTRMERSFFALAFEAERRLVTGLPFAGGRPAAAAPPLAPPPGAAPLLDSPLAAPPPGAAAPLPLPFVSCVRFPFTTSTPPRNPSKRPPMPGAPPTEF
mmetsp:Transcript_6398/g.25850  ORF Transcript_6398/g.25850 Transcript_6398/m.25850 type:complete len:200 (+) Transcript_6398:345-944(+)